MGQQANEVGEHQNAVEEPQVARIAAEKWTGADLVMVLGGGVVGGAVAAVLYDLHFWIQVGPLEVLHPSGAFPQNAVSAFFYWGVGVPLLMTHAIFVGLLVRKRGVIVATVVLGMLPLLAVALALEPLLFGYAPTLVDIAVYVLAGMLLVALAAEALASVLRSTESVPGQALIGLSIPLGWLAFMILQAILPSYEGSASRSFGALDWPTWLLLSGAWAYLVAGIAPAALARGIRRWREASLNNRSPQGPSVAAVHASQREEHPRAMSALILGILGIALFAPLAPVAWVLAARARKEIRNSSGRYRESGTLTAGYVLGIIGTVLMALGAIVLMVILLLAVGASLG